MCRLIGDQLAVAILDEFPWAAEADPGLPFFQKNAWDNIFGNTQLKMLIAGSHIRAMEKLLESDAPLFGRMAGKILVRPFSFVENAPYVLRRESPDYEAVLEEVGRGRHDLEAIAIDSQLASGRAAGILTQLTEVRLVERRIRATVPLSQHGLARHAHYHMADPFLRFYYRFVAANRPASRKTWVRR